MPNHDYILTDSYVDPSDLLEGKGPLIKIEVSPTDSLKEYLLEHDTKPTSVIGWGVLDTGASTTCVNKNTLGGLPE